MQTVTISNPDHLAFDLISRVNIDAAANVAPVITTTPGTAAAAGQPYSYDVDATDTETAFLPAGGGTRRGRPSMRRTACSLDACTSSAATVRFQVRVFDARGGFAVQQWDVQVSGVNSPPVILPIANVTLTEGDLLELPVGATDAEGQPLFYWAEHLPAGAVFDAAALLLRWQTDGASAGIYPGRPHLGRRRRNAASRSFDDHGGQPERGARAGAGDAIATVAEGQAVEIQLHATDADGDALTFGATGLPRGACSMHRPASSPGRPATTTTVSTRSASR